MIYEWDEAKRTSNLQKHGLDFVIADLVHEADFKVTVETTRELGLEKRYMDLAEVEGVVLVLIYTLRGKAIRCISMRPAKRRERRVHDAVRENRPIHE